MKIIYLILFKDGRIKLGCSKDMKEREKPFKTSAAGSYNPKEIKKFPNRDFIDEFGINKVYLQDYLLKTPESGCEEIFKVDLKDLKIILDDPTFETFYYFCDDNNLYSGRGGKRAVLFNKRLVTIKQLRKFDKKSIIDFNAIKLMANLFETTDYKANNIFSKALVDSEIRDYLLSLKLTYENIISDIWFSRKWEIIYK